MSSTQTTDTPSTIGESANGGKVHVGQTLYANDGRVATVVKVGKTNATLRVQGQKDTIKVPLGQINTHSQADYVGHEDDEMMKELCGECEAED